jgi:anti-anti-sigma factor
MSTEFSIHTSTVQGRVPVTIFRLQGQIDATTYEQFQKDAEQAFKTGARYLLLDLNDVNYISSAGLRALHNIYKLFHADAENESREVVSKGISDGTYKAHQLKLLNPNVEVSRILKVAGFDMYLDIFHNQKDAIAAF